jgi:hypothetical protein
MLLLTGPDLEHDRKATANGSPLAMLTVIARYPDGTPFRGAIRCGGEWYRHADEPDKPVMQALPFRTDSRGAVIVNPQVEDGYLICWVDGNGRSGNVTANFEDDPTGVFEIVLGDS